MSLMARVSLTGQPADSPEDLLFSALGVIFPDDATNLHGDADHGVLYTSPHLAEPLHLSLADAVDDADRTLFSHYLWNASLLLAKLIEDATLDVSGTTAADNRFSVASLATLELGAGTALPSLLAALVGDATRVTITDYPSPVVLDNLRANAMRNVPVRAGVAAVSVDGHAWGDFTTQLAQTNRHAFDRVFVCDCLWMPWQHDNLRSSIDWFMREDQNARCWVVAGFHTGRSKVAAFFDAAALAAVGLAIEALWECDCDNHERPWVADRGIEDSTECKRWLCVAILRRTEKRGGESRQP